MTTSLFLMIVSILNITVRYVSYAYVTVLFLTILPGIPTTVQLSGISSKTTEPAPILLFSPIVTAPRIHVPAPTMTLSFKEG